MSTSSLIADALLAQGVAASQANQSDRAIELFSQASAAAPQSGVPLFLIGSEYAALGDMDKAEAAFANAVLLAPNLTIARYQLGLLQFSSGRAALALVSWQPLLDLDPADPLPHFVRGFAALAQDDLQPALDHFRVGLMQPSNNPALSADIQKVIERIVALQNQGDVPSVEATPKATPNDEPADADGSHSHVLLSNYRSNGRPH